MSKTNFFQTIFRIFDKKKYPTRNEIDKIPSFILENYFLFENKYLDIITFLTNITVPTYIKYKFLYIVIPKSRWLKYPKFKKQESLNAKDNELVAKLQNKYMVTYNVAIDYLKKLKENDQTKFLNQL